MARYLPSQLAQESAYEPTWVVRDMLPRGTLVTLAGEPGVGKSVLSYSLAYAVAGKRQFLGFDTTQTRVLYFDEENSYPDFAQYHHWIRLGHGFTDEELPNLDDHLRLEHFTLVAGWTEPMAAILKDWRPGLVIVDTTTPAFHIEDENSNSEAGKVIQKLRVMQKIAANETTFMLLKHEKQRDEDTHRRTIRGAKMWLGAVDQTMYHTKRAGRPRKDGLRKSRLEPDKLRAYGLRHSVSIEPAWTDASPKGLILRGIVDLTPEAPASD